MTDGCNVTLIYLPRASPSRPRYSNILIKDLLRLLRIADRYKAEVLAERNIEKRTLKLTVLTRTELKWECHIPKHMRSYTKIVRKKEHKR